MSFLLKDTGILIFNVNKKPFNYSEKLLWAQRRKIYYGREADDLDISFLFEFHTKLFLEMVFEIKDIFEEKRNKGYLSYLILELDRITNFN